MEQDPRKNRNQHMKQREKKRNAVYVSNGEKREGHGKSEKKRSADDWRRAGKESRAAGESTLERKQ
eukprot:5335316-Heterocapsa_arctica.AAC.1